MGHKAHSVGIGYQSISGNSRFSLISLGKTAIDDQQLPTAFDRRLSLFQFHRNMPVHDMGLSAVQPELHQNLIDHILAVQLPERAIIPNIILQKCKKGRI